MTKPRKEQVRNLKTNYKTILASDWNIVGSSQNFVEIYNDTGNGFYYYNEFMQGTATGVPDGSDQNCPATVFSLFGAQGPWTPSVGSSFTIRMSGLNSNNPMSVTIQAGDLVTIANASRLTTYALVDRINAVTTAAGSPVPAATADRGRIIIRSVNTTGYDVGSTVSMTLSDVTPGILNTFGLASSTSITAYGKNASTRGLITSSPDGLGGYLEIRNEDRTPVYTEPQNMVRNIQGSTISYIPEEPPGVPVYGRIRYSPGPIDDGRKIEISTWRQYSAGAKLILRRPNITTLNGTDSFTITLRNLPQFGSTIATITPSFLTSSATTMSDIVAQINSAWGSIIGFSQNLNPRLGCVQLGRGPYSFAAASGFRFGIGFGTVTSISFTAGEVVTEAQMVTRLNAAITSAGFGSILQVQHSPASYGIRIIATNPGQSVGIRPPAGTDPSMHAMEVVGISPGTYKGVELARLHGNDAIEIVNPIPNSQILWAASAGTATKLGIATSGSVSSIVEPVPTNTVMSVYKDISIPESLEFWEVPDDIESDNRQFFTELRPRDVTTNDSWISAAGTPVLLGDNLRIPARYLPSRYTSLSADQMSFMSDPASYTTDWVTPKILVNHASSGNYNLVMQSTPIDGVDTDNGAIRTYVSSLGMYLAVNARRDNVNGTWVSDSLNPSSSYLWYAVGNEIGCYTHAVSNTPWSGTSWTSTDFFIRSNITVAGNITTPFSMNFTSNYAGSPNLDVARIKVDRSDHGGTPTGNQKYTLVMESEINGAGASRPLRIYMSHSLGSTSMAQPSPELSINGYVFTVNAKWNQATGLWSRDVTTDYGTAWIVSHRIAGSIGGVDDGDAGFGLMRSPNSNTWADTAWVRTGHYYHEKGLNGDYSKMTLFGSPTLTMGPTSVSASNTIRSWSRGNYNNPASIATTGTPASDLAFNVSSIARIGTGIYTVTYTTNIDYPTVLVSSVSNTVNTMFQAPSNFSTASSFRMLKVVSGSQSDGAGTDQASHITMGQLRNGYIYP